MFDACEQTESDIDAVLIEFNGDTRGAILGLLHDLWILTVDYEQAVSAGYVRGEMSASADRMMARRLALGE